MRRLFVTANARRADAAIRVYVAFRRCEATVPSTEYGMPTPTNARDTDIRCEIMPAPAATLTRENDTGTPYGASKPR